MLYLSVCNTAYKRIMLSVAAVQNFTSSTAMALAAQMWTKMIAVQDLWSYMALQAGNIEEIKQQLAEHRQNINTGTISAFPCYPR